MKHAPEVLLDHDAISALRNLYDAIQRGDFANIGVERSDECQTAITLLGKHGDTFDEFLRRSGSIDKHGDVTA